MLLFIENKYTRIYYSIIEKAKNIEFDEDTYTEKHHIIPKSLGGSNYKDNIVNLSARQHYICHRLLVKMTEGENKRKMWYALNQMKSRKTFQQNHKISSRDYEYIKNEFNKVNHFNDPDWQKKYGRKKGEYKVSDETKIKLKEAWIKRKQNPKDKTMMCGRKHSNETRYKISQNRKGKCVGKDNPFYGKTHTDEMKEHFKSRPQNQNPPWTKIKKECPHCGKVLDPGNYAQFHGEKCKLNI